MFVLQKNDVSNPLYVVILAPKMMGIERTSYILVQLVIPSFFKRPVFWGTSKHRVQNDWTTRNGRWNWRTSRTSTESTKRWHRSWTRRRVTVRLTASHHLTWDLKMARKSVVLGRKMDHVEYPWCLFRFLLRFPRFPGWLALRTLTCGIQMFAVRFGFVDLCNKRLGSMWI